MEETLVGNCTGKACGYGVYSVVALQEHVDRGLADEVGLTIDMLGCDDGSGSCWTASMVEADTSSFHTPALQTATRDIIRALGAIGPGPTGMKLSFVHTTQGTMLAWVDHGGKFPKEAHTIHSNPADLKQALKIR